MLEDKIYMSAYMSGGMPVCGNHSQKVVWDYRGRDMTYRSRNRHIKVTVCARMLRPYLQAEWGLFVRIKGNCSKWCKTNRTLRTACTDVPCILWKAAICCCDARVWLKMVLDGRWLVHGMPLHHLWSFIASHGHSRPFTITFGLSRSFIVPCGSAILKALTLWKGTRQESCLFWLLE